jgi:hypothetical protein
VDVNRRDLSDRRIDPPLDIEMKRVSGSAACDLGEDSDVLPAVDGAALRYVERILPAAG